MGKLELIFITSAYDSFLSSAVTHPTLSEYHHHLIYSQMATKTVSLEELRANKTRNKFYILIHGKGMPANRSLPFMPNLTIFYSQCTTARSSWMRCVFGSLYSISLADFSIKAPGRRRGHSR